MQAGHRDTRKPGTEVEALMVFWGRSNRMHGRKGRAPSPVWQWMFWGKFSPARECRRWFETLRAGPGGGCVGGRTGNIIGKALGKAN